MRLKIDEVIEKLQEIRSQIPEWYLLQMEQDESFRVWDGAQNLDLISIIQNQIGGLNCHTAPKGAVINIVTSYAKSI